MSASTPARSASVAFATPATDPPRDPSVPPAVTDGLFEGMGPHHREITTDSPEAQAFFDQGLTWMFAFNHAEAIRSFLRAAELDPDCAMAWWGVSLAAGPQYNHPVMDEERIADNNRSATL